MSDFIVYLLIWISVDKSGWVNQFQIQALSHASPPPFFSQELEPQKGQRDRVRANPDGRAAPSFHLQRTKYLVERSNVFR